MAHGRTFVLGRVVPADSRLTLNDNPVQVHRRGGFLVVVPVSPGTNKLRFEASRGRRVASLSMVLGVRCLKQHVPGDPPKIEMSSMIPRQPCAMAPDEELWVSFVGTPGCRASCGYRGRTDRADLVETERPGGVAGYAGTEEALATYYGKAPDPPSAGGCLLLELTSPTGASITEVGPEIRSLDRQRWVVSNRLTVLRPSPWGPPAWWLPQSCPVRIRGTMGSHLLVEREGTLLGWGRDLEPYEGARPRTARLPPPTVGNQDGDLLVCVPAAERLPYRVALSEDRDRLDVTIAGGLPPPTTANGVRWTENDGAPVASVDLSPQNGWGYRCRWTDEGLNLVVRRPPPSRDLAGILVCIDPGHGPQAGAVGPTGIREQSVNFALATELERCLAARGARVVLTRRGPRGPSLGDRVAFAEEARADFLLSLHHNAVPDGVDPYLNMGTSVYYFHQHCKPLAQHLHKALVAQLGLGDLGVRYGDLALCRGTYMPSVLLEPAFMISPDHEALVITHDYRRRCARAITDGLEAYLAGVSHQVS